MTSDQRDIRHELDILKHAEKSGSVVKICRYFSIGRSIFYKWRELLAKHDEKGLINRPLIPKWHDNRTSTEIEK